MANNTTSKTSTVSTSWSAMAAAPVIKAAPTATIKSNTPKSTLSTVATLKPQPKPGMCAPPPANKSSSSSSHSSSSSSSDSSNKTQPVQVLKPVFFDVKCTGLKPLTVHKFYYEGIDVSEFCTLITSAGMSLPTTTGLVTDSNGSISFRFNFKADLQATVIGLDKTKYTPAGDKKFELKATGSSASKIVPYKN